MKGKGAQFDALDVSTPQQLPMFMTGRELRSSITVAQDQRDYETMGTMWQRKRMEAESPGRYGGHGAGVADSMRERGYDGPPVRLAVGKSPKTTNYKGTIVRGGEGYSTLRDGYHRTIVASDRDEQFVPVEHSMLGTNTTSGRWQWEATQAAERKDQ